jgi:hypothetical protein
VRLLTLLTLMWSALATLYAMPTVAVAEQKTVRDAMWIWAHYEGSLNNAWGLPSNSLITPAEGARSMGLHNLILIQHLGKPTPPFDDYAKPLRSLNKIMWSVTGANGATSVREREAVLALAARMPNITGVFMDDFFSFQVGEQSQSTSAEAPAALSVKDLKRLRKQLTVNGRKLDLGVTLYTHQLDERIVSHLKYCDIVSLWTWKAADLAHLEENFAKFQSIAPGKRVLLGLYMWDFGISKPMPLDMMKKQCSLALKWFYEGRIEGMIFLATNICDMNLEAVNWTRSWIADVGNQPVR